jgi:hypothetical protein
MKPYDLSVLPESEAQTYAALEHCFRDIPESVKIHGYEEPVEITPHLLSRAVAQVFPSLKVVDGIFINKHEHSWLRTPTGRIIEVMPVDVPTGPFLINVTSMDSPRVCFQYRVMSPSEVERRYGEMLRDYCFRLAIVKIARLIRKKAYLYCARKLEVKNKIQHRRVTPTLSPAS